ncbi:MAG TPA: DedA family protein [Flavobacteriales bacterium]|nr:DedA family protein [Flavobacteriales bacterium]HIA10559.1 DedA family protein [Flavobacteriales bacterium]
MARLKDFILFKWLKQLKDWVESFSEKPNGERALFIFAFIEASFFPIPPDVLLIAMGFSVPSRAFRFAIICTAGSLAGAVLGYSIGMYFSDLGMSMINFFDPSQNAVDKIDGWFLEYGFGGILLAAITPIPFKVFTIASGLFEYPFWLFMSASLIGRSFRFFLVSALFYFFGKQIKPFIDKNFEVLAIVFSILLVAGFVGLKYMH